MATVITKTGVTTSSKLSVFAATTSAELAGVISDETGTGALVFANTPTLVTPILGVATATSVAQSGTRARTAAQFDATTNTTLANVTGLSINVSAGATYAFTAVLHLATDIVGAGKVAIAGTATATAIIYQVIIIDAGDPTTTTGQRATAMGTAVVSGLATTAAYVTVTGAITVNAAGTLTVQFAQSVSNGTSSVLIGSTLTVEQVS